MINGQTIPVVTGEYELTGKSRGASTAKRTIGGAAIGSIIGALAGGGKGAAIGAGVGGGTGAGSEIITKGDQVKIPSETLLDFTLRAGSVDTPRVLGKEAGPLSMMATFDGRRVLRGGNVPRHKSGLVCEIVLST